MLCFCFLAWLGNTRKNRQGLTPLKRRTTAWFVRINNMFNFISIRYSSLSTSNLNAFIICFLLSNVSHNPETSTAGLSHSVSRHASDCTISLSINRISGDNCCALYITHHYSLLCAESEWANHPRFTSLLDDNCKDKHFLIEQKFLLKKLTKSHHFSW